MAGIQQAVSSLATGLAYARKVREYGSMQKANLKVQEQRLALQKQKTSIQRLKEKNRAKELDIKEYQAKTARKLANAKVKAKRSSEDNDIYPENLLNSKFGFDKNSYIAEQMRQGGKK